MAQVLDHGYIKYVRGYGSDRAVIEDARMSTMKGFRGWARDSRLLEYLYTHKHMTPFEGSGATFEIKAPILVFREWHRHRTQCLSGDTLVIFERPCDGRAYPMKLHDLVKKWNPPEAKRRRKDQSPLSIAEFNRQRLSSMRIRGAGQNEHLVDAWHSGEKEVWKIVTKYGEVTASADHLFKTPEGAGRLCDGITHVMAMVLAGEARNHDIVEFEGVEEWREVLDGLEVSSWGRARSYYVQGAKSRRETPTLKTININSSGRSVVSFAGKPHQVSRLVAQAFGIGGGDDQILHKNDNPQDNRPCNLYAGTAADNIRDQYVNGGMKRLREVPVEVMSVQRVGWEDVFDITVTGDHWFVANNLIVHNSYSEMSGRYVELPDQNYIPEAGRILDACNAVTKNKQLQGVSHSQVKGYTDAYKVQEQLRVEYRCQQLTYESLLAQGLPKELARTVLPVGRYSVMRATASLRNWLAFLTLRNDPAAQYEIRVYAEQLEALLERKFPRTLALFNGGRND